MPTFICLHKPNNVKSFIRIYLRGGRHPDAGLCSVLFTWYETFHHTRCKETTVLSSRGIAGSFRMSRSVQFVTHDTVKAEIFCHSPL